jgi:hypothetical protein
VAGDWVNNETRVHVPNEAATDINQNDRLCQARSAHTDDAICGSIRVLEIKDIPHEDEHAGGYRSGGRSLDHSRNRRALN